MTSGQEMNIEIAKHDDAVVASPVGEIDLARSPSLRNHLAEILAEKPARLIIDLAQVLRNRDVGAQFAVDGLEDGGSGSVHPVSRPGILGVDRNREVC